MEHGKDLPFGTIVIASNNKKDKNAYRVYFYNKNGTVISYNYNPLSYFTITSKLYIIPYKYFNVKDPTSFVRTIDSGINYGAINI